MKIHIKTRDDVKSVPAVFSYDDTGKTKSQKMAPGSALLVSEIRESGENFILKKIAIPGTVTISKQDFPEKFRIKTINE